MYGTEIGILKEADKIILYGVLKSCDGDTSQAEVAVIVLADFSYQSFEG